MNQFHKPGGRDHASASSLPSSCRVELLEDDETIHHPSLSGCIGKSKPPQKAFVSKAGWFSLLHPINWEVEEDEYIAIYDPQGVGALYISTHQAPGPVDPTAELLEHLSQENPAAHHNIKTSLEGSNTVASFEAVDEQSFQKVWFVAYDSYLVIATYNSDAIDHKEKEINKIEEMVRSVEIRPKVSRN